MGRPKILYGTGRSHRINICPGHSARLPAEVTSNRTGLDLPVYVAWRRIFPYGRAIDRP